MKYQLGQRVTGKINNIVDYGLFVSLNGVSGLVHESDFGANWEREKGHFQIGQEVRVVITKLEKHKVALSLKRVNDSDLVDPTNQFSDLAASDFETTLANLVEQSQSEIKKLKDDL
ncbi:S1 RNA-binding domain-containing protein [Lactobacillus psittaci]|uniref:S1 motif domain-containing protein n=1 Tax=Lactobacillus psittaci DSM 15354 TaxID=1122152 RepID=A0A0R1S095_9LACO|nr:S1 RNA-binding domain-containing protein [Lactobacillus psittaci]KRL62567.1 hypothetical protein FC23_GL001334 [Lactobacillus psittaci DSM 15354]